VIVLSLVLASVTLPLLSRRLKLVDAAPDRAAEVAVRIAATKAAIAAVETAQVGIAQRRPAPERVAAIATRILEPYRHRLARDVHVEGETERTMNDELERELRLAGLRAERDEIRRHGRLHAIDDLAVRRMVRELDLQEARFLG